MCADYILIPVQPHFNTKTCSFPWPGLPWRFAISSNSANPSWDFQVLHRRTYDPVNIEFRSQFWFEPSKTRTKTRLNNLNYIIIIVEQGCRNKTVQANTWFHSTWSHQTGKPAIPNPKVTEWRLWLSSSRILLLCIPQSWSMLPRSWIFKYVSMPVHIWWWFKMLGGLYRRRSFTHAWNSVHFAKLIMGILLATTVFFVASNAVHMTAIWAAVFARLT